MSNFFISTGSMSGAARSSIAGAQAELVRRQKEIASGKIADAGLELGYGTRETTALRQALSWSEAIQGTNALQAARLDVSQSRLAEMETVANSFVSGLLAARGSSETAPILTQSATAMKSLVDGLNSELAGEYVFGGMASDEPPLHDYFQAGGSPGRSAVQQAFQAEFGIPAGDPAANSIDPAAMAAFLDNAFAGQFTDPAWTSTWSRAASENPTIRIALGEQHEVGANANEAPFRLLAQAYVMVGDLGVGSLNQQTRDVVLAKATELAGAAMSGLVGVRSRLGIAQERIATATERLSAQGDIVSQRLAKVENVDPYAAATELNELLTRLEASYATTARIQRLSLLDYL